MTLPLKITYSDKLNKLERQYEQLLVSMSSNLASKTLVVFQSV